ncbi:MAG: SurA N-terminal domain-containing protein [Candidatus Sumerlaeia bacterium]|nr:SurA N-terminal domain-containing protein [Candidatus Sumerlaeia bacterium]
MIACRSRFMLVALVLVAATLSAQNVSPLVREEPSTTVRVRTGRDARQTPPAATPAPDAPAVPTPAATPDPETVIVAVVNQHSLTRAQVDRRVAAITGYSPASLRDESMRMTRSTPGVIVQDLAKTDASLLDLMLLRDAQTIEVEEAVRAEAGNIVEEWIDQMVLADEARRQGLVISDQEFRTRLAQFTQDFRLRDRRVQDALEAIGMTQAELEGHIYDALLIEKLLARYVDLNYTTETLRQAYERNPVYFFTPPAVTIAHFVITISPSETEEYRRGYRQLAERVRRRLNSNENHQKIFDEVNDIELGVFGSEFTWSLESRMLDDRLRERLSRMKVGEVSDILTMHIRLDNQLVPESYQVVKVLGRTEARGTTFEDALPRIQLVLGELARTQVLEKVKAARTHRVVSRLSGIPPDKLPSPAEVRVPKPPVNLKES